MHWVVAVNFANMRAAVVLLQLYNVGVLSVLIISGSFYSVAKHQGRWWWHLGLQEHLIRPPIVQGSQSTGMLNWRYRYHA